MATDPTPRADAPPKQHEHFACGAVRPPETRPYGKYTIICELPRLHSGDHEHYGGMRWANLSDDPLAALLARTAALEADARPIQDLPAFTPLANLIRRCAAGTLKWYKIENAARIAGTIAVSVTLADFQSALAETDALELQSARSTDTGEAHARG